MDTFEAIANRKTIRNFAPQSIPEETIKRLLTAGMQAPTNDHLRSWHFILLQERSRRQALLQQIINPVGHQEAVGIVDRSGMTDVDQKAMYVDAIPRQFSMLMDCAVLILPCFLQKKPLLQPEDLSALNRFASIWCCIENILIAAAAEGIFGVVRIPEEDERVTIKTVLQIPEGYEVPCHLALGYPAESAKRARQVEIPLEERIHTDGW
jgi:nitroreductase